jgi:hypothetical protein
MSAFLLAIALATPAHAGDEAAPAAEEPKKEASGKEPWRRTGVGWGGFPYANYSTDTGVGFGAIGSIFYYDGMTAPYKSELYFLIFASTKNVHTHRLQYDWLEVGGQPLRLTSRVEFSADLAGNYCGYVAPGECDPDVALLAADNAGLVDNPKADDDAYDAFVTNYYQTREIRPNAYVLGRYAFQEEGTRLEVFGSYYGELKKPGDFSETGPYAGSAYAQDFPDGEPGYVSLVQIGLMADGRDNEPAPIRGNWAEVSVRAAGKATGSSFGFGGLNLTERFYIPLGTDRLVLADRLVWDGMWGAPPTSEMVRSGSTDFYNWFGGQRAGRGIRWRRVFGEVKTMNQVELRATVASLGSKTVVDITPIGFLDAAHIAEDFSSIGDGIFAYGYGGGARIAINKNFILRGDVGFSPLEDGPGIYLDVKNLW